MINNELHGIIDILETDNTNIRFKLQLPKTAAKPSSTKIGRTNIQLIQIHDTFGGDSYSDTLPMSLIASTLQTQLRDAYAHAQEKEKEKENSKEERPKSVRSSTIAKPSITINKSNDNHNNINDNYNYNYNDNQMIKIIGYCIINCLSELYEKYMSNTAEFTINIQSQTRQMLYYIFDERYYQIFKSQSKPKMPSRRAMLAKSFKNIFFSSSNDVNKKSTQKGKNKINQDHDKNIKSCKMSANMNDEIPKPRLKVSNQMHSQFENKMLEFVNVEQNNDCKTNININNTHIYHYNSRSKANSDSDMPSARMGGKKDTIDKPDLDIEHSVDSINSGHETNVNVNTEFGARNKDISDSGAIRWLLLEILPAVEVAVIEISRLMNDSYMRFKKDTQTFEKTLQFATRARSGSHGFGNHLTV